MSSILRSRQRARRNEGRAIALAHGGSQRSYAIRPAYNGRALRLCNVGLCRRIEWKRKHRIEWEMVFERAPCRA